MLLGSLTHGVDWLAHHWRIGPDRNLLVAAVKDGHEDASEVIRRLEKLQIPFLTSACRGLGLGDAFSGRQFSAVIAQNNIDRWDHENGEQRGGRQAEQQRDGETLKDRIDQDCGRPDHRRQCR